MGMYTRLTFWAQVKPESPAVPILRYLATYEDKPTEWPGHELFSADHFESLLGCSSYYHNTSSSRFVYDDIAHCWFLNIDSSLKNYDGEIKKFLDWFAPHDSRYDGFCGFYQYEEDEDPTLIYRSGDVYEFVAVRHESASTTN